MRKKERVTLLHLDEIKSLLTDVDVVAIANATGLTYSTLYNIRASRHGANYNTLLVLSEYFAKHK